MLVRNTVSGVVVDLPAEKALGHEWFSRFYIPVEKNKNEVLAPAYEIVDGERRLIEEPEAPEAADEEKSLADAEPEVKEIEPAVGDHKVIDGAAPATTAKSMKAPKPSDIQKGDK